VEAASGWVNNSDDLTLATFPLYYRWHYFFGFSRMELNLFCLKLVFIQFNVLTRVSDCLVDDVDTDHLFGILAQA
jgi:hypothetical protein